MLANLLQVAERRIQLLHHRAHTTQRSVLQLLAAVQRVSVLQQTDIVLADLRHHVLRRVDLTESQLVVVTVIQNVDEIRKEGVDFLHSQLPPNTHL